MWERGESERERKRERNHLTIHHISYSCVFGTLDEVNEWTERAHIQAPNQSHSWRTSNTHVVKSIHRSVNVFRRFPSHSFLCSRLTVAENAATAATTTTTNVCGDIFVFLFVLGAHSFVCGDLPIYSFVSRRSSLVTSNQCFHQYISQFWLCSSQ